MTAGLVLLEGRAAGAARERHAPVFVVGSPRSGTTFLGQSLASLPGFVDGGELPDFKPMLPDLIGRSPRTIAGALRHAVRDALGGDMQRGRLVVHAPELSFVAHVLKRVEPGTLVVHIVRDGRDVASSLVRDGWLSAATSELDVNGWALGSAPRFWTEQSRRREFSEVSDARRAAWAWRRYVSAAFDLAAPGRDSVLVRYESLCSDSAFFGEALAAMAGCDPAGLSRALSGAHAGSVGRYERELTSSDLADVEAEAGALLTRLGYLGGAAAGPRSGTRLPEPW